MVALLDCTPNAANATITTSPRIVFNFLLLTHIARKLIELQKKLQSHAPLEWLVTISRLTCIQRLPPSFSSHNLHDHIDEPEI